MRFGRRRAARGVASDVPAGREGDESTPPTTSIAMILPPVARSDRFTFQDLVAEATADVGSRPGRLIMTIVGTVLGIGSLVATVGFAQTAANQIATQFDAVAATTVVVTPAEAKAGADKTVAAGVIPWDGPERVEKLVGVQGAALLAPIDLGGESITAVPVVDPSQAQQAPPPLLATSGDFLAAFRGHVVTGRMFDGGHVARGDRVAVLGRNAAEQLGVSRIETQPSIFLAGVPYAVIGIVDGFDRKTSLRDAVLIPTGAAQQDFRLAVPDELHVRIEVGAGPQVAAQSRLTLAPNAPESLKAAAPAKRSGLAGNVQSDLSIVFLILGVVVLLAGALGIANVTMLNVSERVGEIGLRRALGATRRQIAAQFMVESVVIGLLGGLIGAGVGVFGVVAISLLQGWTPAIDPWIALAGAVLGAFVGFAAGWYPSRRAARIEPVAALRGN